MVKRVVPLDALLDFIEEGVQRSLESRVTGDRTTLEALAEVGILRRLTGFVERNHETIVGDDDE